MVKIWNIVTYLIMIIAITSTITDRQIMAEDELINSAEIMTLPDVIESARKGIISLVGIELIRTDKNEFIIVMAWRDIAMNKVRDKSHLAIFDAKNNKLDIASAIDRILYIDIWNNYIFAYTMLDGIQVFDVSDKGKLDCQGYIKAEYDYFIFCDYDSDGRQEILIPFLEDIYAYLLTKDNHAEDVLTSYDGELIINDCIKASSLESNKGYVVIDSVQEKGIKYLTIQYIREIDNIILMN